MGILEGVDLEDSFTEVPFKGGTREEGWQEVVMLRQLRITRSLIPQCPTSGAIYIALFRCVGVGRERAPTIPPGPMCGLQWLYAIVNAREKTGR